MRTGLSILAITALSACGTDQSASASNESGAQLTSTPISFADAVGDNSEMQEAGPCPFVSDKTIIASVRSSFEITRNEVSGSKCRWAYNAGFAIEVTIEDAATARPVAQRRYNMDIDPVLEPQSGPGKNAVVLNDTAFGNPLPYAYSFEQDGRLVFMSYTGFKTNTAIMRPAADEIARRMGDAPEMEAQRRELIVPFEACEVWSEGDIKLAFEAGAGASPMTGRRGPSTCAWEMREDGVDGIRTAAFNIFKPTPGQKSEHEYPAYKPYEENGETHFLRKSDSDFGTYIHIVTPRTEGIVHTTVSDANDDATEVAKRLHYNLLERLAL